MRLPEQTATRLLREVSYLRQFIGWLNPGWFGLHPVREEDRILGGSDIPTGQAGGFDFLFHVEYLTTKVSQFKIQRLDAEILEQRTRQDFPDGGWSEFIVVLPAYGNHDLTGAFNFYRLWDERGESPVGKRALMQDLSCLLNRADWRKVEQEMVTHPTTANLFVLQPVSLAMALVHQHPEYKLPLMGLIWRKVNDRGEQFFTCFDCLAYDWTQITKRRMAGAES